MCSHNALRNMHTVQVASAMACSSGCRQGTAKPRMTWNAKVKMVYHSLTFSSARRNMWAKKGRTFATRICFAWYALNSQTAIHQMALAWNKHLLLTTIPWFMVYIHPSMANRLDQANESAIPKIRIPLHRPDRHISISCLEPQLSWVKIFGSSTLTVFQRALSLSLCLYFFPFFFIFLFYFFILFFLPFFLSYFILFFLSLFLYSLFFFLSLFFLSFFFFLSLFISLFLSFFLSLFLSFFIYYVLSSFPKSLQK